ncbi:MAG: 30S ribosomal protein S20 [Chitinophagales bacterium]
MAHHKAAKKSIRQAEKRNELNRYHGKTTRNAIKKLKNTTDAAEASKLIPDVVSMVDKLAKRKVIHKNKAAHLKSQLMKKAKAAATK